LRSEARVRTVPCDTAPTTSFSVEYA